MRNTTSLAALAAGVMLLGGCAANADSESAGPKAATHTMPNGSVMSGTDHQHGDGHEHGHGPAAPDHGPSAAAQMICGGDVAQDVTRILGLVRHPESRAAWEEPVFTCTYDLKEGPLTLSVHDATDRQAGRAHFDAVRADLGETKSLKGMYGLGLPAYETDDGTVVFIRDGKTLRVDATALPGSLGTDEDMSQTELSYAVATSVLACWTDHA